LVPNIPAFERMLKTDLGGDFAKELKERENETVKDITTPQLLDEKFQAMLLADTIARAAKGRTTC
jgi:hypothetical protein